MMKTICLDSGEVFKVPTAAEGRVIAQSYEDCAGQVTNPATFNPASFVAADVGLTTVAAGTRLFCQTAGGSCVAGVYVATSATAATLSNTGADSVQQGKKLKVTGLSSGPVEYWQTAATGSGTAVFAKLASPPPVIFAPSADPSAAAAGLAVLNTAVAWCSSLNVTATTVGKAYSTADHSGFTHPHVTISSGVAAADGSNAALYVPDNVNGTHPVIVTPMNVAVGKRAKMTGRFKKNATVSGQADGIDVSVNNNATRIIFDDFGNCRTPGGSLVGITNRHWLRADGWHMFSIEWTVTEVTTYLWFYSSSAGYTYTGDTTTGITISNLVVTEITATALNNQATGGTSVISSASTIAPWVETSLCPDDGWWPDGSACLRYWATSDRYSSFDSTGYTAVSGTAQAVTMSFLWAPYQKAVANAKIFSFAGSAAVLKLEHTTTDGLKITRTTDASVTTTITFATVIGHVPQACSVVLDGTNALLYIQGVLVESQAMSLAGTTTFTSGRIGGALSARVAEYALHASALTAAQITQAHSTLAVNRGWRIEPIPVWFYMGQSNAMDQDDGRLLPTFGAPGRALPVLHYESAISSATNGTTRGTGWLGWGPSRCNHYTDWADSPTVFNVYAGLDIGSQGNAGGTLGLEQFMGYSAIVRFAAPSQAVASYLPSGTDNALMLSELDAAVANLGIPYVVKGFVFVWGESDAILFSTASIYASQLKAFIAYLAARYSVTSPLVVMNKVHVNTTLVNMLGYIFPFKDLVRSQQQYLGDSGDVTALVSVDDLAISPTDGVHMSVGTELITVGQRLAKAVAALVNPAPRRQIDANS